MSSRLQRPAALLLLLAAASWTVSVRAADASAELARVEREIALDRAEVELAKSDTFYVVLDGEHALLRLTYRGATLREYPLRSILVGYPHVWHLRTEPAAGWDLKAWKAGQLLPAPAFERDVIVPPPPAPAGDTQEVAAESPVIPPPPEEMFPAPRRWRLSFAGGLALEVAAESASPGVVTRLAEGAQALGFGLRDAVRVRVALDAKDAGALYRALPPDSGLLLRLAPR